MIEKKNEIHRTLDEAKELILKVFNNIDWEYLNSITHEIQLKAGVTLQKKVSIKGIEFKSLPNKRTFEMPFDIQFDDKPDTISVIHKEEDKILGCDVNTILSNWGGKVSDEEFEIYVKEDLIHEFVHLTSNLVPDEIHHNIKDLRKPHTIIRSGVITAEVIGVKMTKVEWGRLNEVLTEYISFLLMTRYFPKSRNQQYKKHWDSYTDFIYLFNSVVLAIHKETGVNIDTIRNSFLRYYFTNEKINFLQELNPDIRKVFFELSKSETDYNINRENFKNLMKKYKISQQEIMQSMLGASI